MFMIAISYGDRSPNVAVFKDGWNVFDTFLQCAIDKRPCTVRFEGYNGSAFNIGTAETSGGKISLRWH